MEGYYQCIQANIVARTGRGIICGSALLCIDHENCSLVNVQDVFESNGIQSAVKNAIGHIKHFDINWNQ